MSSNSPLFAIVGPTASGKSDLGIALAKSIGGEIINADSVQLYRRIYVATAKVPPNEQQGIPHHLIDVLDPVDDYTAVAWAESARTVISEIEQSGRRAILVGGSGFYLRALGTQFCESPAVDPGIRSRLQKLLTLRGPQQLHRVLTRVDPELARRYPIRDWSRVLRALEVYFSSGIPLSKWQEETPASSTPERDRLRFLVLNPPRDALYARINTRADQMIAAGLVEEVKDLIEDGVPPTAKAFGAHGYKRVVEFLCGMRTLESAIEQMKLDTRHYAKRQWTWWRKEPSAFWLDGFGFEESVQTAALRIVAEADRNAFAAGQVSPGALSPH